MMKWAELYKEQQPFRDVVSRMAAKYGGVFLGVESYLRQYRTGGEHHDWRSAKNAAGLDVVVGLVLDQMAVAWEESAGEEGLFRSKVRNKLSAISAGISKLWLAAVPAGDVQLRVSSCKCDCCGHICELDGIIPLEEVKDLGERLDPGSVVPAGECKVCGALTYHLS